VVHVEVHDRHPLHSIHTKLSLNIL
jgi:hypothetical protein